MVTPVTQPVILVAEERNKEEIKMKKIIIVLVALMLLSAAVVSAANQAQGANGQKNGDNNASVNATKNDNVPTQNAYQVNTQTQQQTANQGVNTSIQVQQQIRSTIQQKEIEANNTMANSTQNQKMAQVAVQAMEATAPMFGKSEANISKVSNEIKNSFEITTRAEERIKSRSGFVKFLAGGDNEAAGLIAQEIVRNENRIRELNRLIEESDFDPETKAILQEQVQNIEQEQLRLKTLAQNEINNKGILGWIWK